jgi:hypothetical protein
MEELTNDEKLANFLKELPPADPKTQTPQQLALQLYW